MHASFNIVYEEKHYYATGENRSILVFL